MYKKALLAIATIVSFNTVAMDKDYNKGLMGFLGFSVKKISEVSNGKLQMTLEDRQKAFFYGTTALVTAINPFASHAYFKTTEAVSDICSYDKKN